VFNRTAAYRDKVVGVFVRFRAPIPLSIRIKLNWIKIVWTANDFGRNKSAPQYDAEEGRFVAGRFSNKRCKTK
jgi:hypothetical protein